MSGSEGGDVASPPFRLFGRLRDAVRRRRRPDVRIARAYAAWLAGETHDGGPADGPRISVLLPVYHPPLPFLQAAIVSVKNQAYGNWELCIADDASPGRDVQMMIQDMAGQDSRIKRVRLPVNGGIAVATNAALALATGPFVALMDHDDVLPLHALSRVAAELAAHPDADVVFSDEDQLVGGRRCRPYFKPGWNPDLMLSQNLLAHFVVYRRSLIEGIGAMRAEFAGSQDYDLALRATASVPATAIRHIPEVLYHWRQHGESYSARRAAQCEGAARAALAAHAGEGAEAVAHPGMPQWTRIAFGVPVPAPLVSLILPGGAAAPAGAGYGAVETCADTAAAAGDILVFLAKDLSPGQQGWLRELVSQVLRPGVGCAGPRLEGPDGRIADAGLVLHPDDIAHSLSPRSDSGDPGYFGQFVLCRTVSAVARTGMAVRRDVFASLGGFDPRAGAYEDVDFCLRLAERGLRCVWTPLARLRYRKLPGRREDAPGALYMKQHWGGALARDPYANPNLVIRAKTLDLADCPPTPPRRPTAS